MGDGTIPCHRCDGTGRLPDPRVAGAELRRRRIERGLGLRETARLAGCSVAHLSDMERGNRMPSGRAYERVMAVLRREAP